MIKMLRILTKLLISGLFVFSSTSLWASSNGLFLNADSAGIHYIGNLNDGLVKNSRLDAQAFYSQGPDPRNLLFSGALELPKYNFIIGNKPPLTPKAAFIFSDFIDNTVMAFAAGGIVRLPKIKEYKFDTWAEILAAPPLTSFSSGKYLWSLKIQLDHPIAKGAAINLGYRKIMIKLDNEKKDAFDQGLYFGLSTLF